MIVPNHHSDPGAGMIVNSNNWVVPNPLDIEDLMLTALSSHKCNMSVVGTAPSFDAMSLLVLDDDSDDETTSVTSEQEVELTPALRISQSEQRERESASSQEQPMSCSVPSISLNNNCMMYKKYVSFPSEAKLESYQEAPDCHLTAWVTDLWYEPQDFARFRYMAQLEASTIQWNRESSTFLELLEHSFHIAARLADEVCKYRKRGHRETALWDRIFQKLDINQTGVTSWSIHSEYRGLECFACKPVRQAKFLARRKMRQEIHRQETHSTTSHANGRRSLTAEELAGKLQRRSQLSRLYARMMGIADEKAALHVYREALACASC